MAFLVLLKHLGVGIGDRVALPAIGSAASGAAAVALGARLAFLDSARGHIVADPAAAASALRGKPAAPKVVVVSHPLGFPASIRPWKALADEIGALLIEDCGGAAGATSDGAAVGAVGRAGVYSAGARSPLSAFSGAFVVTSDSGLAEAVRTEVAALPGNSRRGEIVRIAAGSALQSGALGAAAFAWAARAEGRPPGRGWTALQEHLLEEVVDLWGERSLKRRSTRPSPALAGLALARLVALPRDLSERLRRWTCVRDALAGQPGAETLAPVPGTTISPTSVPVLVDDAAGAARRLARSGLLAWDQPELNAAALPVFNPHRVPLPSVEDVSRRLLRLPLAVADDPRALARLPAALGPGAGG